MKVVIIEDEQPSRDTLTILLKQHPSIELIGTAASMREGLVLLRSQTPDLVFLDIDLGDGTGFDLLSQLPERNFHLIFITAYNNHALAAFEFGAINYLLKPLSARYLAEAIKKVSEVSSIPGNSNILDQVIQNRHVDKLPTRIAIHTATVGCYLEIENIVRFEGNGDSTNIYLQDEKNPIVSTKKLNLFARQFELYTQFHRVNKSQLVNLNYVKKIIRTDGGALILKDINNTVINISRIYRDDLTTAFSKL